MLTIGPSAGLKVRDVILIIILGLFLTVLSYAPTVARSVGWATPEWSLIFVLYLAFRAETHYAGLAAFILGCFQDALTIAPEGLESFALLLLVIIVTFASDFMTVSNFILVFLAALASLLKNILFIPGFLSVMGLYHSPSAVILYDCLIKACVTGVAALPALALLDRWVRRGQKKR